MANRSHRLSPFEKSPAHITRLRIPMFAQAIRTVGVVMFGLCGGSMLMTLTYSSKLTACAAVGLGLFLLGYWLIPFYAEPENDL
ncbi:hypothetical protein [Caulobacter sp. LARHSG274]